MRTFRARIEAGTLDASGTGVALRTAATLGLAVVAAMAGPDARTFIVAAFSAPVRRRFESMVRGLFGR